MKKPRRKYSPKRQAFKLSKSFSQKYAIVWAGTLTSQVVRISTSNSVQLQKCEVEAITTVPHRWRVYACVMSRDINGREFIQSEELLFKSGDHYIECRSEEISDLVNERCNQLYHSCNKNLSVNVGWIATPAREPLTDKQLSDMMTNIGAWEFLAKWETVK